MKHSTPCCFYVFPFRYIGSQSEPLRRARVACNATTSSPHVCIIIQWGISPLYYNFLSSDCHLPSHNLLTFVKVRQADRSNRDPHCK